MRRQQYKGIMGGLQGLDYNSVGQISLSVLFLLAVLVNFLYPSYQAYYTTFSTLVTLQAVTIPVLFCTLDAPGLDLLGRCLCSISFILSLLATIQAGRDAGHCMSTEQSDREDANNCIDLYASYAALDGPHGVKNACATLGEPV